MDAYLDLIRAARRSRIKTRVWAALVTSTAATPAELAEAANTTVRRVHAVMHGDGRGFSHETSLVALGVARPLRQGYAITAAGRATWGALRHRFGYTEAQISGRWPSPDPHVTVR